MNIQATEIEGVYIVEPERRYDSRGFFARTWCREAFITVGINPDLSQCSVSFNIRRGTLRGMHYQRPPYTEDKLVRCTRGAIYDVALDLRASSPTYRSWVALELNADDLRMLYIPEGCAHGFQTLCDATEVSYQISRPYHAEFADGYRYDDPAFAISWPEPVHSISARDLTWGSFNAKHSISFKRG